MNLWIPWCSSPVSEKETCRLCIVEPVSKVQGGHHHDHESHECFGLVWWETPHVAKSQIHRRADLLFELRKGGRCGLLQWGTQSDSAPLAQDLFPLQKWWLAKLTTSWRQNPRLGPRSEMGSYALLLSWKSDEKRRYHTCWKRLLEGNRGWEFFKFRYLKDTGDAGRKSSIGNSKRSFQILTPKRGL